MLYVCELLPYECVLFILSDYDQERSGDDYNHSGVKLYSDALTCYIALPLVGL